MRDKTLFEEFFTYCTLRSTALTDINFKFQKNIPLTIKSLSDDEKQRDVAQIIFCLAILVSKHRNVRVFQSFTRNPVGTLDAF